MLHSDRTDFSFSLQIRPFFGRSMRSRPFAHAHLRTVAVGASSLYPANHRKLRKCHVTWMNHVISVCPKTESFFQWLLLFCAGVTEAMDSLIPSGKYIASAFRV